MSQHFTKKNPALIYESWEKALGQKDRRMGSLAAFENALVLTPVTEQRRFHMRDTAGG